MFLRRPHQGRSGYVALMLFLLAYTATLAFVIAPEYALSVIDAGLARPFE